MRGQASHEASCGCDPSVSGALEGTPATLLAHKPAVEQTLRLMHYSCGVWQAFEKTYLAPGTASPRGKIVRTWWRHEDQRRGSLHIHCAIWVEESNTPDAPNAHTDGVASAATGPSPAAICGTVPRNCRTPAEKAWRDFILATHIHNCREGKCYEKGAPPVCGEHRPQTSSLLPAQPECDSG